MDHALVLDIDNTLTPPRRPLTRDMAEVLTSLTVPFFLDAGSDLPLVRRQFLEPLHGFGYRGELHAFLCNGAKRYRCTFGSELSVDLVRDFDLEEQIGAANLQRLLRVLGSLLEKEEFQLPSPLKVIGEQIVLRGAMINFAPIGRPTGEISKEAYRNRDVFVIFDAETGYRRRMLECLTREIEKLSLGARLCLMLGGQTSFDICVEGNDKSYPLRVLLDEGYQRLSYVGDALFEGGNDGAVLEFVRRWPGESACPVETIRVESWRETPARLVALGLVGSAGPRSG